MFKKLLFAGWALVGFLGLNMSASAAELGIRGTIVPGACSVNLDNGGIVDFNDLTAQEVINFGGPGTAYVAPPKSIVLRIKCEQPSRISLGLADNKSLTKFNLGETDDEFGYGMGEVRGGKKIGQYRVDFTKLNGTPTQDGTIQPPIAYFLNLSDITDERAWSNATGSGAKYFHPKKDLGFQWTGFGGRPERVSYVEGALNISTFINKDVVDNANQAINFDGSSTFTVHYH